MSIAQFGVAERSIAETRPTTRRGRTPTSRLVVAQSDQAGPSAPR